MIRKAFKKWKKRLLKPKKKSNDDSMDEISNNVNTNELPLEHENQSSDDSSVQLAKTGNENVCNIPSEYKDLDSSIPSKILIFLLATHWSTHKGTLVVKNVY